MQLLTDNLLKPSASVDSRIRPVHTAIHFRIGSLFSIVIAIFICNVYSWILCTRVQTHMPMLLIFASCNISNEVR